MEKRKLSNIFENLEVFDNMYVNFIDGNISEETHEQLVDLFSSKTCKRDFAAFTIDLLHSVLDLNKAGILQYNEKDLSIVLNGIEKRFTFLIETLSTQENKKSFYAWIGNLDKYKRELLNDSSKKRPPVYHQGKENYPFGIVITFKAIEDLEKSLSLIRKAKLPFQYRFGFSNLLFIREKTQNKLDKNLDNLTDLFAINNINPVKFEKLP